MIKKSSQQVSRVRSPLFFSTNSSDKDLSKGKRGGVGRAGAQGYVSVREKIYTHKNTQHPQIFIQKKIGREVVGDWKSGWGER